MLAPEGLDRQVHLGSQGKLGPREDQVYLVLQVALELEVQPDQQVQPEQEVQLVPQGLLEVQAHEVEQELVVLRVHLDLRAGTANQEDLDFLVLSVPQVDLDLRVRQVLRVVALQELDDQGNLEKEELQVLQAYQDLREGQALLDLQAQQEEQDLPDQPVQLVALVLLVHKVAREAQALQVPEDHQVFQVKMDDRVPQEPLEFKDHLAEMVDLVLQDLVQEELQVPQGQGDLRDQRDLPDHLVQPEALERLVLPVQLDLPVLPAQLVQLEEQVPLDHKEELEPQVLFTFA